MSQRDINNTYIGFTQQTDKLEFVELFVLWCAVSMRYALRLPCVKGAGPEGLRDCAVKCFHTDNESAKRDHKGHYPF